MRRLLYLKDILFTFIRFRFFLKSLGKRTVIKQALCIKGGKYINVGEKCFIHKHARIEAVDLYNKQQFMPSITISDKVFIQQNFHCTCADTVFIGTGTSITANVGIFDIIHPYQDVTTNPREQDIEIKSVYIGKNCLIGMNSVILPGTVLGNHNVVGANSVVKGVFPDYVVIAGIPAKVIKKYNLATSCWEEVR